MRRKRMNRRLCFWNPASHPASGQPLNGGKQATRKASSRRSANFPYRHGLLALSLLLPATAMAGPTGEQVTAGVATITRPNAATTLINQQTQKAIIDWQNFSIAQKELVRFLQPNSSSVALNRVLGNDPSRIYGNLTANGQVFLVNPNGVLFGPGSQVSVHGLLATTHDINNDDFMAGRYFFTREKNLLSGTEIVNQGTLQATENGYIVLAGDYAANSGLIQARLGQVALASGNHFTIDLDGDQLIGLAVDEASLAQRAGVENFGTIAADGGRVLMTAKVAGELATAVVNNEGLIQAQSIEELNGEIILHGGTSGVVTNSGTLDASGFKNSENGGNVQVLGEKVALIENGIVEVSGTNGGGTALIGGDFQGKSPEIQNATATFVGQDTFIRADAIENGDGGRVIVWADDTTRAYGSISAKGGAAGGDGGFVEVSGKNYLDFRGMANTNAPLGATGTLLLDPTDITITATGGTPTFGSFTLSGSDEIFDGDTNATSSMGWDYINGLLSANNVIVQTDSAGAGTGTITFSEAATSAGGSNSLSFLAESDISVNSGCDISFTSSGDLIMVAGWLPASGYVTPTATNTAGSISINADISSNSGGNIKLLAKDTLAVTNAIISTTSTGAMTLGATDITLSGTSNAARAEVLGSGSQTITASGILTLSADAGEASISAATGDQTVSAAQIELFGSSTTASQPATITTTGGGIQDVTASGAGGISITGGSQTDAYAGIIAEGGTQNVTTTETTSTLTIASGSGDNAYATIGTIGDTIQNVTVAKNLTISGGSGLGAFADIYQGGSLAQTVTINNGGTVAITGGSASDDANAGIFSDSTGGQTLTFTAAGALSLTGGTVGVHNIAGVNNSTSGPLTISGDPTITLIGGATGAATSFNDSNSAHIGSELGTVTINAASLSLTGGTADYADVFIKSGDSQTINVTGNIDLNAGPGQNSMATIHAAATTQDVTAGGGITIAGGSGLDSLALIETSSNTAQNITANAITISGGSGDDSFAEIYQNTGTATQIVTINGGGTVAITGGDAADGARAGIFSSSTGGQTLNFASGGVLDINGGTVGTNNDAEYGNIVGAPVTITGATYPTITLDGGATGTATSDAGCNGAYITAEGGALSIDALSLSVTGGAADYGYAALTGTTINLSANGAIDLTGGSGVESGAVIGSEGTATDIILSSNSLSLTGNATGGMAAIGSIGGTATVGINNTSTITANYAAIGNFTDYNVYGPGSVSITAGGNMTFTNTVIGGLGTDAATPTDGAVSLTSSGGTLSLGTNTLVRGGDISLFTDDLTVDPTAAIVAGSPTSYTYSDVGAVSIEPYTAAVPMNVAGTPSAGGELNLTTTELDRINPTGWLDGNSDGVAAGGALLLGQSTSTLTVTGELFEPGGMYINLYGSAITQTAGSIIHDTLAANGGTANLPEANTVAILDATLTGDFTLNTVAANLNIFNSLDVAGNIAITSPYAVAINDDIISAGGNITLTAGGDLTQMDGHLLSTTGAGTIYVSSAGNISAGSGTIASTDTGDISYLATGTTTVTESQLMTSGTLTVTGTPYVPPSDPIPPPPTPTLDDCLLDPTIDGCTEVLPTLDDCTTDPTLEGCTEVLPTLDDCTTDPTLEGCTEVLPTLDDCTSDPTLEGCTTVLPTLDDCTSDPTMEGCTTVLPTVDDCTTDPTLEGCTTVLPTLDDCTTDPTLEGCTTILPTLDDCTTDPTLEGCTTVLPTLDDCTTDPTMEGCTTVLPTLDDCTTDPTAEGCTTVLPTVDDCIVDPTAEGCTAVLPPELLETPAEEVVETIQAVVIVDLEVPTETVPMESGIQTPDPDSTSASEPVQEQPAASSEADADADNDNNEEDEERTAEEMALADDSQEQPLAKQPIFDLSGGGVAGQNMVCK
ncbi:beta strand repeat-containing protein [Thermodesulfobacteriota bacterium]